MRIQFESRKLECKSPFGAVCAHEEMFFRIGVSHVAGAAEPVSATLFFREDGQEKRPVCTGTAEDGGPEERDFHFRHREERPGLYFYGFSVHFADGTAEETGEYQLTCYQEDYHTPDWLKEGVMYQIFPDRFARSGSFVPPRQSKDYVLREDWGGAPISGPAEDGRVWNNDFFGGNLRGITERLADLKELGVTVLYLNPIFEAFSNHRYDTADYKKIDPLLGTEEDFRELCQEAAGREIRVVLDGVFNHTGSDSLYFNKTGRFPEVGAYQSRDSAYSSWYTFSEFPDRYDCWWGIDTLPSVNETEESYLNYILRDEDSVVRHWLRLGASGFRLDVADELPDLFLDELRRVVKEEKPDAAVIGEVWEDASNKVAYGRRRRYFQGKQLDSVMNYPLKEALIRFLKGGITAAELGGQVEVLRENYPAPAFYSLMNILGTHDTPRILTVLEDRRLLFSALLIWAFLPGIPCVYYGDELGMEGGRDPDNRRCYQPEGADPEIRGFYRKVLGLRNRIDKIGTMELEPISLPEGGESCWAFQRVREDRRVLVCVNVGETDFRLDPGLGPKEGIEDFITAGYVDFSDLRTFRMAGKAGVAVVISSIGDR